VTMDFFELELLQGGLWPRERWDHPTPSAA
jgi:hypothetical protein